MLVKTLVEDTTRSPLLNSEHGLSIYIETNNKKILFDTGAGNLFLKNARKMGVDIRDIDIAVISHGHYDHGGGLRTFLEENENALVIFIKMHLIIITLKPGRNPVNAGSTVFKMA
jgi:7,8-dihydropterin-6-yl-methyl-4-(beta-D-ribofuranosyl)aminobenzene 5'-phosphate synthase